MADDDPTTSTRPQRLTATPDRFDPTATPDHFDPTATPDDYTQVYYWRTPR